MAPKMKHTTQEAQLRAALPILERKVSTMWAELARGRPMGTRTALDGLAHEALSAIERIAASQPPRSWASGSRRKGT